jgi:hypothetical protein
MVSPFASGDSAPAESIFVHGPDETAASTLVVALALRRHGAFSWADCAIPSASAPPGDGGALARGISRPAGAGVSRTDFLTPRWSSASLERLLVPERRLDSLHLLSYLSLPNLLQELAALSTSRTGESTIFLANIDALDPTLRASVLGQAAVHSRLHTECVSLLVTSRGRPTPSEETLFDHIFRLEIRSPLNWPDGLLHVEKSPSARGVGPIPLREMWESLGLDPTLLPLPGPTREDPAEPEERPPQDRPRTESRLPAPSRGPPDVD